MSSSEGEGKLFLSTYSGAPAEVKHASRMLDVAESKRLDIEVNAQQGNKPAVFDLLQLNYYFRYAERYASSENLNNSVRRRIKDSIKAKRAEAATILKALRG